jgi:CRISPR-associated protein Cas1
MNSPDTLRDVPECIPARILNEHSYCPRLAYLEWARSEFVDNYYTEEGRLKHRHVDKELGTMPEPTENDGAPAVARSLWLSAPSEHLTAKIDLVECSGRIAVPIDYKRGSVPDTPERSWPSDRVQICAQALTLRSAGYQCTEGVLYYSASKKRISVPITEELVTQTRTLVKEIRKNAEKRNPPLPLEDSAKCEGCSLAGICLPDETNLLSGRISTEPTEEKGDGIRRLVPGRDEGIPLYVQEQGCRLTTRGETLQVIKKTEKLGEARFFETSHVGVFGHVEITTPTIRELCSRNTPITFFSVGGWFYGMVMGLSHKNVEIRIAQFDTARNPENCLEIASRMIEAKIRNCRTLLMRNHPDLPEETSVRLRNLASATRSSDSAEALLGFEGATARAYFGLFSAMLRKKAGSTWAFDFKSRNRRPPLDPVNAMLSLAYALLAKDLTITALSVGFDPYLGFLHKPRYGRPALALDLMEEFRPIVADSVVLGVVNNGVIMPDDFITRGNAVAMKDTARRKFIQAYERRMDSLITHPVFGYRLSYRRVLEVQARLLSRAVTGELDEYTAFTTR